MQLSYNIDFELAAAVFDLILWIGLNIVLTNKSNIGKAFNELTLWVLIATVLDITTALTISNGTVVPLIFNNIINTIYFAVLAITGYSYSKYINTYMGRKNKKDSFVYINRLITGIYAVVLVINIPFGFVFKFDANAGYVHGQLYVIAFLLPLYYLIYALIVVAKNRKKFTKRQVISFMAYVAIIILGTALQFFVLPDYLLTMFFVSVGIWIVFLIMETPNYQLLLNAVGKLNNMTKDAKGFALQAIQANRIKNEFLKNIVNDLKNPVSKMNAYSRRIIAKSKDYDVSADAEKIVCLIDKLNTILKDLNDYIGFVEEDEKLEIEEYSPREMLKDLVQKGNSAAKDKNIDFEYEIDKGFPEKIYGDKSRLFQIIETLIKNSLKFTQAGKIRLKAIWHPIDSKKGKMSIEVSDTGVGMRSEEIESLNESLKTGIVGTNQNVKGRGLGLCIASKILSLMGSRLKINSEYGKGSTFSFDVLQGIDEPIDAAMNFINDNRNVSGEPDLKEDLLLNKIEEIKLEAEQDEKQKLKPKLVKIDTNKIAGKIAKVNGSEIEEIRIDDLIDSALKEDSISKTKLKKSDNKETEIKMKPSLDGKNATEENKLRKAVTQTIEKDKNSVKLETKNDEPIKRVAPQYMSKKIEASKNDKQKTQTHKLLRGDVLKLQNGLKGFDVELGLRYCMNDATFYKDMLKTYAENEKVGELLTYLQMENWNGFQLALHSVRNTSQTIGAMDIAREAKNLELAFKKGDLNYVKSNARTFVDKYQKTISVIKDYHEEV